MGACFAVYKQMGAGFLEAVYQECLAIELRRRGIPFAAQAQLRLTYSGIVLDQAYIADFLCFDKIILELKALTELNDAHRAQILNYLAATGHSLGLLINFGHHPRLQYERIIRTDRHATCGHKELSAQV
jgi:GxxExxY protein